MSPWMRLKGAETALHETLTRAGSHTPLTDRELAALCLQALAQAATAISAIRQILQEEAAS